MSTLCAIADVLTYIGKASDATDAELGLLEMLLPLTDDAIVTYLGYSVIQAEHTHFLPNDDYSYGDELTGLDVVNNKVAIETNSNISVLFLPERPVRSNSTITVVEDSSSTGGQGASDFSGSALTQGTDYYVDETSDGVSWNGMLIRKYANWPSRRRTVKVTYTAGLTVAELDAGTVRGPGGVNVRQIKYAAILAATAAFWEAKRHQANAVGAVGAAKSERLADYSITYADESVRNLSLNYDIPEKSRQLLEPFRRLPL